MADFEDKKISELERLTGDLTPQSLVETAYNDSQMAEDEFATRAATVEQVGRTIVNDIEYASELDTVAKTIIDAINEVNEKAGHGGGGSTVTIADNPEGGIDITVDGETYTVLKKNENIELKRENEENRVNNFITPEGVAVTRFDGDVGKEALALSAGENWGVVQVSAWGDGVDKSASLVSEITGSYLTMDDVTIKAPQLSDVLTHEQRIEALEQGGDVTKDYVDNGFTSDPNVKINTRLGTTGAEATQAGYCVTDKLYIDASKTIIWRCGNHQTASAYLVLFNDADTKVQYFKMSKGYYEINLADYPSYSYLRATFFMEDDTHKTIEDTDGNILFEVDMVGKHIDGLVGLNESIDELKDNTSTLLKAKKVTIFNGTINAGQTPDWVSIANASGIDGSRIMAISYAFGPASSWDKDIVMKTIVTSTGYTAIFTNKGSAEITVQIEAQIIYI